MKSWTPKGLLLKDTEEEREKINRQREREFENISVLPGSLLNYLL